MTLTKYYPASTVEMRPGDILYSPISRATYYVGHTVIIGSNLIVKEAIPGTPSGHMLTIKQFWNRHCKGDKIILLRSKNGAQEAAEWATNNLQYVKQYHLGNYNINRFDQNYCSKFIVQAYYHGANIKLTSLLNRFISPQFLTITNKLEKVALFEVG